MDEEEAVYSNGDLMEKATPPPQSPQYDRIIQEEKVANFISQTSPSKSLVKINLILKGYIYDDEQKVWVKVTEGIPDQVRVDALQILTPHLSEDVRMGRLERQQINGIMEFLIEWSVDYLDIVADSYKLSEEQMTKICIIIWSAVFHVLTRAENGIERDRMYASLKIGDDLGAYQVEKPKGIFDSILPWK